MLIFVCGTRGCDCGDLKFFVMLMHIFVWLGGGPSIGGIVDGHAWK